MTRQRRQIADDPDVLAAPSDHRPTRPAWTCAADGEDWPCEPLRRHLLVTLSRQEIGVAMDGYYQFAVYEIHAAPAEVHHRLFGWIRA